MRQLSASSVHAAMRCGYAFRDGVWTAPDTTSVAAKFGTLVHALVEDALCANYDKRFDVVKGSEEHKHAKQVFSWVNYSTPGTPDYVEKGVLYNALTDTAEWGPRRDEPGYDVTPHGCIRGTIDMAWVFGGMLWVVDLKTGKTANAHPEQLYFQAVAMSRILGIEVVNVGFLFSRLTKVIPPEWETLDEERLYDEGRRLRVLLRSLPTAEPQRHSGCHYCLAVTQCPAFAVEAPAQRFDDEFELGDV